MSAFLLEAFKGIQAEMDAMPTFEQKVQRLPVVLGILLKEVFALFGLIPYAVSTMALYRSLPKLASFGRSKAVTHGMGVAVHRDVSYGPGQRAVMDIYVPQDKELQDEAGLGLRPVVFFVHGGVWASGEKWHYAPMATRLVQEGFMVVVPTYNLYPTVLVPQMVSEVSSSLSWCFDNIQEYGGDAKRIHAVGHSAGGHLVAMVMICRAAAAAAASVFSEPCDLKKGLRGGLSSGASVALEELPGTSAGTSAGGPCNSCLYNVTDGRMPSLVVGMAGVYDVAKHYEFERARDVHEISMMKRAMDGFGGFAAMSPTTILRAARAAVVSISASSEDIASLSQPHGVESSLNKEPAYFKTFELFGQAIPHRAGLDKSAALKTPPLVNNHHFSGQDMSSFLSAEACRHLPPAVIMSSCSDHMVPWHEGAEFVDALHSLGVPARHLIYNHVLHSDYVMSWRPSSSSLHLPQHSTTAQHATSSDPKPLKDFARDLLKILRAQGPAAFPVKSKVTEGLHEPSISKDALKSCSTSSTLTAIQTSGFHSIAHGLHSIAPGLHYPLSRSEGPVVSNVCTFQAESLPGSSFIAYGNSDGALIVSKALKSSNGAEWLPTHPNQAEHGQFTTSLIIDELLEQGVEDEMFELIAWGGGPCHLLAAVTSQHLFIFSLRNYILGMSQSPSQLNVLTSETSVESPRKEENDDCPRLPSYQYHLVSRTGIRNQVLSLDWTHAGCGLLLTDTAHNVIMMRVVVSGLDSLHVARGGYPDVQAEEAWSVCSDTPHVLAAAGLDAMHPCATAPRSDKSSQQHRVTIWWPQQDTSSQAAAKSAAGSAPNSSNQTLSSAVKGVAPSTSSCHVGAESIRHPVKVLSLQWSPALASHPTLTPPSTSLTLPVETMQGSQAAAAALPAPVSRSLALLTVGQDWCIRIWVEVIMRDLFPGATGTSAPGVSMSQYCLTLVIEPPVQGLTPGLLPGLRACWARPLPGNNSRHVLAEGGRWVRQQQGAAGTQGQGDDDEEELSSKVHWVVASISVPGSIKGHLEEQVCLWAIDSLSGVILSGLPRGGSSSSKTSAPKAILWGRCGAPCEGPSRLSVPIMKVLKTSSMSTNPAAGAAGMPGPAISPTGARVLGSPGRAPTSAAGGAVITPAPDLSWIDAQELLAAQGPSLGLAAYVVYPEGVPVIHAIDHFSVGNGGYAEVRALEVATITKDSEDNGSWTPPSTSIVIRSLCQQQLLGSKEELTSFEVHPGVDVAAALDSNGSLSLWYLSPVEQIPLSLPSTADPQCSRLLCSGLNTASWFPLQHSSSHNNKTDSYQLATSSPSSNTWRSTIICYIIVSGAQLNPCIYAIQLPTLPILPPNSSHLSPLYQPCWRAHVIACVMQLEVSDGAYTVLKTVSSFFPDGNTTAGPEGKPSPITLFNQEDLATHQCSRTFVVLAVLTSGSSKEAAVEVASPSGGASLSPVGGTARAQPMMYQQWILNAQLSSGLLASDTGYPAPSCSTPSVHMHFTEVSSGTFPLSQSHLDQGMEVCPCCFCTEGCSLVLLLGAANGAVQRLLIQYNSASPLLLQQVPCSSPAVLSSNTSSPASSENCCVTQVAVHTASGYAAASVTSGGMARRDAVVIWRKHVTLRMADPGDDIPVRQSACSQEGPGSAAGRLSASEALLAEELVEEAWLSLEDSVSFLAWVTAAGLVPMLALALDSGLVLLYCCDRQGIWLPVARHCGMPSKPLALSGLSNGTLALTSGRQIVVLSNMLDQQTPQDATPFSSTVLNTSQTSPSEASLPAVAQGLCGSLPPYHPQALSALLAKGRLGTACCVLRKLLSWMRTVVKKLEMEDWSAIRWQSAVAELADPWILFEALSETGSTDSDACMALPGSKGMSCLLQMLQSPVPVSLTGLTAGFMSQSSLHSVAISGKTEPGHFGLASNWQTLNNVNANPKYNPADDGMPMKLLSSILGSAASVQAPAMPQKEWSGSNNLKLDGIGSSMRPVSSTYANPLASLGSGTGKDNPESSSSSGIALPKPSQVRLPADPMSSGVLDMSAFGFGASFSPDDVEDTQREEVAAGTGCPLSFHSNPVATKNPVPKSLLETGMLDMSVFGFGNVDDAPEPPPAPSPVVLQPSPPPPPPPPAPAPPASSPHPLQPSALDTGMIDMSAFGFGATAAEQKVEEQASISPVSLGIQEEAGLHDGAFNKANKDRKLLIFPRLLEQPASTGLPDLLLDAEELGDLLKLLGAGKQEGVVSTDDSLEADATASPLLPSYLREEDPRVEAAKVSRRLLSLLHLSQEQAQQLCQLASAVSRADASLNAASSSMVSSSVILQVTESGGDVMSKLDTGARVFLSTCRVAADLDRLQGLAKAAEKAKAEARDSSNLFRPVTVSKMDRSTTVPDKGASLTPAASAASLTEGTWEGQRTVGEPSTGDVPQDTYAGGTRRRRRGVHTPLPSVHTSAAALRGKLGKETQSAGTSGGNSSKTSMQTSLSSPGMMGMSTTAPSRAVSVLSFKSMEEQSVKDECLATPPFTEVMRLMPGLEARALLWAASSSCQGSLLEASMQHVESRPHEDQRVSPSASGFTSVAQSAASARRNAGGYSWSQLRRAGAGLWLLSDADARTAAESVAKSQFAQYRDPHECMLLYLALGKKAVLQNLFRQTSNIKLADFLQRDFRNEDHKKAAAKNAFALLGQHRYEMAASFFILADQYWDAVGVLAHELQDPQLALFVARLLQGGAGGACSQRLILEDLLPHAKNHGDSNAQAVLLWAAGRPQEALLSLLKTDVPEIGDSSENHRHAAAAAAASDPGGGAAQDPFALDLLLATLHHFSGRPVPASLPMDVACLAVKSASVLQAAGLPSMAVEAVNVVSKLLEHIRWCDVQGSMEMLPDPLGRLCEHLLAASWAPVATANQLNYSSFDQRVGHHEDSPTLTGQSSAEIVCIHQRLSMLKAAGLGFDHSAVQALLQKHVQCTAPADHQPLLPPLKLRHLWTSRDGSAPAPYPSTSGSPPTQHQMSLDADAPSAFAMYQAAHGGIHSHRTSLAVSRTTRDSVTFGGTSPPAGNGGPRSPTASPSAAPQLPNSALLPSRSSSGVSATSVAASLQHHDTHHPHHPHLAHQGSLFEEPLDVINIEGDKCRATASSGLVTPDGHGRPFAVVTGNSGLLWGGLSAPSTAAKQQQQLQQSPASLFLGLMQQVLDHVRWTPDPWAVMANDVRENTGPSTSASHTHSAAVAAHPERDLFLSGSSSDHVFLWKHGETSSRATYLPLLERDAHKPTPNSRQLLPDFILAQHWETAVALQYSRKGSHFAGLGEGGLVAVWRQDRVGSHGLGYAEWTHHCLQKRGYDLALLSDEGHQLVACGRGEKGGTLCWWDMLSPPGSGLVAEIRGRKADPTALTLVHAPAGPLLVFGDEAGDLTALDLRMLSSRAPLWSLPRAHHGPVTSVSCWASGTSTAPTTCISLPGNRAGAAGLPTGASISAPAAVVPLQQLMVSGSKDGSILVVDVQSGKVMDALDKVHYAASKNPFVVLSKAIEGIGSHNVDQNHHQGSAGGRNSGGGSSRKSKPSGITGAAVTSVVCLQDGVLSCGVDGAVRFHGLAADQLA
ncbi:hypothetical protein CEUSTIGMA_g518.t1 [Chlamydomonas eustigma]|uniref:protein-S-isoprenylcysteine alpha-carbonyl methylesterase n=1 Tax=Chlamydomonas eustigma TaxID=1157962 RepID=A0A250WQE3_9CHLO|nr:hypothetical protein CEUSTIGMA_g518.t1 [Chlamydomonas eustigma]|eukprot:GAX73065.1 hypothetical protein CEUSTIGMA_g518.t1 [Chlamydomonas eustigma]